MGIQIGFTYFCYQHTGNFVDEYFRTDRIAILFMVVITILASTTILHSIFFASKRNETSNIIAVHNIALMLLISLMNGVLISEDLTLLCAFLEATTLASTMLIYRNRSKKNFEEAWKYFFVCSIGIALAFVGILFIIIAAKETNNPDINLTVLAKNIPMMDPLSLKVAFIFVLAGFSVKIGVVPLFPTVVDAKDTAPAHISALFSGCMTIIGFVAIFRFYELFSISPSLNHWMNTVLVLTGITSIVCAALYSLKKNNYRRMLAYSGVEHAGIVLIALTAGHLGYIAAIVHLISYAFIKATLFYQLGTTSSWEQANENGLPENYSKKDPIGIAIVLLATLMLLAIPPSGLFISEFMLIKALFLNGKWMILFPMLALLMWTFAMLAKRMFALLYNPSNEIKGIQINGNLYEALPQIILLLLVMWIGINPPAEVIAYLEKAIEHLPR